MSYKSPVYEERRNAEDGECLQESGDAPRHKQHLDIGDRSPPTDLPESPLGCSRETRTLVLRPPHTAHIQNSVRQGTSPTYILRYLSVFGLFYSPSPTTQIREISNLFKIIILQKIHILQKYFTLTLNKFN